MTADPGGRLFASLPAVYRAGDASGDLAALLGVFEELLFKGSGPAGSALRGIELGLYDIPCLFAPLGDPDAGRTPERFLHWLARWLAFSPHAHFSATALRRILAGIVPLYGLRGTRDYLVRLIELCFEGEIAGVQVDDRPRVGFTVGRSRIGVDTRLARGRAFWFEVTVDAAPAGRDGVHAEESSAALERRLRAVIDFARPAHTSYALQWRPAPQRDAPAGP